MNTPTTRKRSADADRQVPDTPDGQLANTGTVEDPSERCQLFVYGLNHHSADLETREALALDRKETDFFSRRLRFVSGFRENLILATCNRLEIYGLVANLDETDCRAAIQSVFDEFRSICPSVFKDHFYWKTGLEAIQHCFRVAAGADSQVVGETEVLGQIKEAYAEAAARRSTGPWLHRVFQKSFQAAKWVRTNTGIGHGHVSLGNIVVALAQRAVGDLQASRTLVLGSGIVGEKAARALSTHGVGELHISSRRWERAEKLAETIGGKTLKAVSFGQWHEHLAYYDIIICSTASPGNIITRQEVEAAVKERNGRPLFLIDLAVPRDIEDSAREIPHVQLHNLEDLAAIANENLRSRQSEIERCESYLQEKARQLWEILSY